MHLKQLEFFLKIMILVYQNLQALSTLVQRQQTKRKLKKKAHQSHPLLQPSSLQLLILGRLIPVGMPGTISLKSSGTSEACKRIARATSKYCRGMAQV